jgi:DHA2 family multidrug resistance protein-like MFS transporter
MHDEKDGLPTPQRYWATLTLAVSIALAVMDSSIANVALPNIAADLGVSPAQAILVVNAYQICVVLALLPLASLGELIGHERVYRGGLALFTLASLLCSLSDSLLSLTVCRALQGLGAAGLMSVNTALVRYIYPQRLLGTGIGINTLVVAASSVMGPTLGAGILAVAHWPWIFAVNIPLGVLALVLAGRFLPTTPRAGRRFDAPSALLSAATFGLLTVAMDMVAHGQNLLLTLLVGLGGLVAGVALVRRQAGRPAPLLPLDLLRIRVFALSIATSISSFTAQMLAFVVLPFLLQHRFGRSPVETGLLITPWPLVLIIVAPLSGRLSDRIPAGLLGGLGLAAMATGLALLATLPDGATNLEIGWRMALSGLGFGLFQTPNNRVLLSSAPRERAGGASGMLSTARLLGQTTGAALAALMLRLSGDAGPVRALALASGIAAVAGLISFSRLAAARR